MEVASGDRASSLRSLQALGLTPGWRGKRWTGQPTPAESGPGIGSFASPYHLVEAVAEARRQRSAVARRPGVDLTGATIRQRHVQGD